MSANGPYVDTERLILRPFGQEDIGFLDDLHSDEQVMRYILGRTRNHDENRAYLDNLLHLEKEYGIGQRLVIRKSDNRPVGRCGMSFFYGVQQEGIWSYQVDPSLILADNKPVRVTELGYTFLREMWGKGYASEAAAAMRDYGLNIQKIPEIHSIIQKENRASVKVAEKIGAIRLGECLSLGHPSWDYLSCLQHENCETMSEKAR